MPREMSLYSHIQHLTRLAEEQDMLDALKMGDFEENSRGVLEQLLMDRRRNK